jgi:citrate lyase beta subunit
MKMSLRFLKNNNTKLIFITADAAQACKAQDAGIDRIMVDLEIMGKDERQGHLVTVISRHTADDVTALRRVLQTSELMVRINPLFEDSQAEIDDVIARGADRLMLPMFRHPDQVARIIDMIAGRVP